MNILIFLKCINNGSMGKSHRFCKSYNCATPTEADKQGSTTEIRPFATAAAIYYR